MANCPHPPTRAPSPIRWERDGVRIQDFVSCPSLKKRAPCPTTRWTGSLIPKPTNNNLMTYFPDSPRLLIKQETFQLAPLPAIHRPKTPNLPTRPPSGVISHLSRSIWARYFHAECVNSVLDGLKVAWRTQFRFRILAV